MKLFKVVDLIQKNLKITTKKKWKIVGNLLKKNWNVVNPEKCEPCRKSHNLFILSSDPRSKKIYTFAHCEYAYKIRLKHVGEDDIPPNYFRN